MVVRGPSCAVVRGRHSLPFCPLRGQHCRAARFAASAAVTHGRTDTRTRGRTTYNTPLNPPGVGWVNFFYPINVIVSIRTCVPNLGSIRGSVRKNCLLSLIIDRIIFFNLFSSADGNGYNIEAVKCFSVERLGTWCLSYSPRFSQKVKLIWCMHTESFKMGANVEFY